MTAIILRVKTIFRHASVSLFMPRSDGHTVIRGGVGLFYDTIDLNVATFTQLQERVLTRFGPDGQQIIGVPQRERLVA